MVLVKNTDSELHPRLLESATWGWSSALCFDRSSKWCWCLLKFQNHWYGLFFGWRNLRREAGWFAPGDSLYSLVLVLDLPRMPLLVLKSYENRGNFRHIWIVLTSIVVQLLSHVQLFVTPWTAACQASLYFTISRSLCKFMSFELVMPSDHPILCHILPSVFSSIRIFSSDSVLHIRWPKYWSFNFNTSPSSEYSGLISFRFYLLVVQGTLWTLQAPQFESINSSMLRDNC